MGVFKDIRGIRHSPKDFIRAAVILGLGIPVLVASAAAAFYYLPLPIVVPDPQPGALAQTSRIYASDGTLIATFHAEHNRELITHEQMPAHLRQAAVAAEDARFYKHSGIDGKAISRALWADIRARATVQGGSTITQQYVKNAYLSSRERTIFRKVREALVANQLERTFSKKKILKDYLNTVYLGKGAYGVQAAAKTYFGKPASELTISESALLVGIIPSPVRNSPYENPATAEVRRLEVIRRMAKQRFINADQAQQARREKPQLQNPKNLVFQHPWFVDALFKDMVNDPRYGENRLFTGGLSIHTTVDPKMQQAAENVLKETLPADSDPHNALASIDPKTGYVKALVGGRTYGHKTERFNLATQAHRSPGSAFKTLVLVAALESGISPSARFSAPGTLRIKGWGNDCQCVRNFGGSGYGSLTVEQATIKSANTAYAQIAQKVGIGKIIEVSKKMGISARSLKDDEKNLAIAIGGFTEGVTPLEMASTYATLAAGGEYRKPKFVTKILDSSGKVLEEGPSPAQRAIDPSVAAAATQVLSKVVTEGTAQKSEIDRPSAGKTGTSQRHTNAWFVGYTPDLSTAIWMGYKDAAREMKIVQGVRNVTGGSIPALMWAKYMRIALDGIPPSEFPAPGQIPKAGATGLQLPPPSAPKASPKPTTPAVTYEEPPTPTPTETPEPLFITPSIVPPSTPTCGLLGCY